jgi:four helix bundle protein
MEKYEEGYAKLLTYKQGMEIYQRTKRFTAAQFDRIRDSRLIGHMNDSARSVPSNIREGAKRGNTKAYLEFLGFARGSLEELKGDYEELKRELKEGERWSNKDREGKNKDREGKDLASRGSESRGSESEGSESRGSASRGSESRGSGGRRSPYVSLSIPINPYKSLSNDKGLQVVIAKEIEGILTLIYGEDCMLGRQVRGLEKKAVDNKDMPQGQMIKRALVNARAADERFWRLAKERFGIEKDEKGIIRQKRKDKEKEGKIRKKKE